MRSVIAASLVMPRTGRWGASFPQDFAARRGARAGAMRSLWGSSPGRQHRTDLRPLSVS